MSPDMSQYAAIDTPFCHSSNPSGRTLRAGPCGKSPLKQVARLQHQPDLARNVSVKNMVTVPARLTARAAWRALSL